MATIKSFTDIEQSRKLAEILPLESADMYYPYYHNPISGASYYDEPIFHKPLNQDKSLVCWSLSALLAVLPAQCECMSLQYINYGNNHKEYFMSYSEGENTEDYVNAIDACYEMVIYLHKINLL